MSQQTRRYASIERDPNVKEGHPKWTAGKEDAAEIIQQKIDAGEWPMPLTELETETGWSRSHYANTIRDLFVEKQQDSGESVDRGRNVTISVPEDVDRMSYLQGWIDCEKQRNGR